MVRIQKIFLAALLLMLASPYTLLYAADSSFFHTEAVEQLKVIRQDLSQLEKQLLTGTSVKTPLVRHEFTPYKNSKSKVSIAYPEGKGWKAGIPAVGIYFENTVHTRDLYWSIRVEEARTMASVIKNANANIVSQANDKKVVTKKIKVDGAAAVHILSTMPSRPNFYGETVIIQGKKPDHAGKFFVITNGGVKDTDFTTFYQSFSFSKKKSAPLNTTTEQKKPTGTTPCLLEKQYGFTYYPTDSTKDVCYKMTAIKGSDSTTIVPLELLPPDVLKKIIPKNFKGTAVDFAFDKNNFYINGQIIYSATKNTFVLKKSHSISNKGEVVINGTTYTVAATGLAGATLQ